MRGDFGTLSHIQLTQIDRDLDQPRKTFNEETIAELANSIREGGLVEPLVVKHHPQRNGYFMLVAGERRLRALSLLGWKTAPCIVKPGEQDTYILSVIENLNREDLNPIDEALVYRKMRDERNMSWRQIHEVTRRSLPTILAKVKLLELPDEIQAMVRTGTLPQVGALSLTQYKGPKGDLIRLAYDLIAGREPSEIQQGTTEHGEAVLRGKVPKDPQQVLSRIMGNLWRTRAMQLLMESFQTQPVSVQEKLLGKLNAPARKNFLENLEVLSKACAQFRASVEPLFRSIEEGTKKPAPQWSTPPEKRGPNVLTRRGKEWRDTWRHTLPNKSTPEPKSVLRVLPPAAKVRLEPLMPPRVRVVPESVDLTTCTSEQLNQAADLLHGIFKFQHSRTPQIERRKRILSRMSGVPEEQVQARVQEAIRIVRQLWLDGQGFTHEQMQRRIATLKESSGAQTFNEFYTVVPTDTKDDTFISFEPLI